MKRSIPLALACLVVSACRGDLNVQVAVGTTPSPGPVTGPGPAASASPAPARALPPARVVALTRTAACPPPNVARGGTYRVERVFAPRPGEALPRTMRDLCAYEWIPSKAGAPPDPAGIPVAELGPLDEDAPVVTPLGAVPPATALAMRDARRALGARADALIGAGAAFALPASSAKPVMIAFVDSSPTRSDGTIPRGRSPHGFEVAWISRFLTCPEGPSHPCASFARTQLALGRSAPTSQPDDTNGGGFGTRAELAAAIYAAVGGWRAHPATPRLVVNLSVGWEPAFECTAPPVESPASQDVAGKPMAAANPVVFESEQQGHPAVVVAAPAMPCASPSPGITLPGQAVYDAIRYAACSGAVVVAAAGNQMGTTGQGGPVLPARWETTAGPTLADCQAQFPGLPTTRAADAEPSSVLYAAGGVGGSDAPIPVSRKGGLPRIVAPASHAVAFPDKPGQDGYPADVPSTDSFVMTGTSVAAAVTSAAAALVWAHRPDLEPAQVMEMVYASGVELGPRPADFCGGATPCKPLRRVSLCEAVKRACSTPPAAASCPAVLPVCHAPSADPVGVAALRPGADGDLLSPATRGLVDVVQGQPGRPTCPDCGVHFQPATYTWVFDASWLDAAYFPDSPGVISLDMPTVRVYDEKNVLVSTTSTGLSPGTFRPVLIGAAPAMTGSGQAKRPIATATLSWRTHMKDGSEGVSLEEIAVR